MKTKCNKCQGNIPSSILIDGVKKRVLWNRQYCFDCSPWGSRNNRRLENYDPEYKECTKCAEILPRSAFSGTNGKCNICVAIQQRQKRQKFKKICCDYLGGKCSNCAYSRCIAALQFHHEDPAHKDFEISRFRHNNFDKIKQELDKCILLCSNCHAEIHFTSEVEGEISTSATAF